jgi:microsomal dipeptidase-like Zn-dependent dipeptidase
VGSRLSALRWSKNAIASASWFAHGTYETVTGALKVATQPMTISHTGMKSDAGKRTITADMQRRMISNEHAKAVADAGGICRHVDASTM